jgi:uncharacterized damage-inducible protein DinB
MARNNRLANLRLLSACAKLAPGEFEAERTGFFPSLKKTLNHILVVDMFYIDALEGGTLGPAAFADEEPCASVDALLARQAGLDERLLALCENLTADTLAEPVRLVREHGRVQMESRGDVLLHLFLHQTHHRGQAHAMLAGTSVKPPQLDEFIVRDDARFRTSELAMLGWSEADLAR